MCPQKNKRELEVILQNGDTSELPASLKDYQAYLVTIRRLMSFAETPELRRVIVRALVHKVEVLPNSFRLHYYVGEERVKPDGREPDPPNGQRRNSGENMINKCPVGTPPAGPFFFFKNFGSKTLTNGAGHRVRTRAALRTKTQ